MNILVTGANGQLGNEMRIVSKNSKDNYIFSDVVGEDIVNLDITDADAIDRFVDDNQIDAIINCAAYTNVDKAETDQALAERLNADAPGILARAMARRGGLLVHISTDYVFGGDPYNVPCREDQTGTPTGVYGLTKLHGEQQILKAFQASAPQPPKGGAAVDDPSLATPPSGGWGAEPKGGFLIIRTAWLYSEYGKNFVKTMLNLTSTKPQLKVVFDQAGTPTYALDLARAIYDIVENRKYPSHSGIYHYSNEGVCSWYDFTKHIAAYAGHTACDIQPCHSSEFPSPVTRPAYSVLDKTKIKETFGIEIPYWTDSLRACLNEISQKSKVKSQE